VLLVEDVAVNRLTLGALLEADGHEVHEAATCAEARLRLKRIVFDVVLLDLDLPDGQGMELIADVRRRKETRLIVLSGSTARPATSLLVDGTMVKGEPYEKLKALMRGA
jgi:two-component system KDP operon response regulator KdpE